MTTPLRHERFLAHPLLDDPINPVTPEQAQAARLAVCGRAWTVDDARELLDMLGLLP
jgi:hypothetical protein